MTEDHLYALVFNGSSALTERDRENEALTAVEQYLIEVGRRTNDQSFGF